MYISSVKVSPVGSLWCSGPCWNTGGTGSWGAVFCWVSLALKRARGLRNGLSGSWVHPRCCSRSRRETHSYTRCCLRPVKLEEEKKTIKILARTAYSHFLWDIICVALDEQQSCGAIVFNLHTLPSPQRTTWPVAQYVGQAIPQI